MHVLRDQFNLHVQVMSHCSKAIVCMGRTIKANVAMPLTQVSAASVKVGAAVTLSNLIDLLLANKSKSTNFEGLADHILKVKSL